MNKLRGELLRAVANGDTAGAERSIRRGADPNSRDDHGAPALFLAALRTDVDMVSALIGMGADPHAQEQRFGRNALGYLLHLPLPGVSPERVAATARMLIAHGLKPDQRPGPDHVSAWWNALLVSQYAPVVLAMLESGVDPNTPLTAENYTPLMAAATNRCVETVKLLLAAGADPCATTTAGATAARLIEEPDKSDPEWDNWSPEATAEMLRLLRQ